MTAVIGILNKSCVALAADSAGTIMGPYGPKISNNSNKLFTLSKYYPVGVMIYNSSELAGVPWEIIIKTYRGILGDQSFPELEGYKTDFIENLKARVKSFPAGHEKSFLRNMVEEYLNRIVAAANIDRSDVKQVNQAVTNQILQDYQSGHHQKANTLDNFADYTLDDFKKDQLADIQDIVSFLRNNIGLQPDALDKLVELVYHMVKSDHFTEGTTGIVFAGYGKQELFPSCISYTFDGVIAGRLRYRYDPHESSNVNQTNLPAILPFAQRDVIDTFLSGISREIQKVYNDTFTKFLSVFQNAAIQMVQPLDPTIASQIASISVMDLTNMFHKDIVSFQDLNHKTNTQQAVAISTKEELAEMAESLVYLTYLKRRTNFEPETVGGPIDVAVITKGDGFVWIKRKHYFKPELNNHFFQNYLRIKKDPN